MSTTRLSLTQSVGNELGRVSGTCSAAGTTVLISDTSADSPFDPDDENTLYKNAWAKIEADGAATPLNVGEVRRVSSYSVGVSVTASRGFTNSTTTTQSYGIYQGVPPARVATQKGIVEYINDTLRSLLHRELTLITLVTDGDMETSGTANWTASNASVTKVALAVLVEHKGGLGKYVLGVANTVANGYATTATMWAGSGRTFSVIAECYCKIGTAKLQLWDATNSAEIESKTSDQTDWRYIYLEGLIPATCESVQVRLIGVESNASIYWDNVSLLAEGARRFNLPTTLINSLAVEEFEMWSGGTGTASSSADAADYEIDERQSTPVFWWRIIDDATGANRWRVEIDPTVPNDRMLLMRSLRPFAELSADTDATDANADLVLAGTLVRIATDKKDKALLDTWLPRYADALRAYQPRFSKRIMPLRPV